MELWLPNKPFSWTQALAFLLITVAYVIHKWHWAGRF
jgi:hypothetical protein